MRIKKGVKEYKEDDVFRYRDTNSSKAGICALADNTDGTNNTEGSGNTEDTNTES